MSRREVIMIGIIMLLVGLLAGLFAGDAFSNDDDSAVITAAEPTTSITTSTTTTTEAPPTTTSSTTTTSTTTTAAPAVTEPFIIEVANVLDGSVLGTPAGGLAEETELILSETFGVPDADTGWGVGCEFDEFQERRIDYGGLSLFFAEIDGVQRYTHWTYRPTGGVPEGTLIYQEQQPDGWALTLHPGVTPDMTLQQVGDAVGIAPFNGEFGFPLVTEDYGWTYLSLEADQFDQPVFEITSDFTICD